MRCGGLPPILPVFGNVVCVFLWGFRLLGCMATAHCGIERTHNILLIYEHKKDFNESTFHSPELDRETSMTHLQDRKLLRLTFITWNEVSFYLTLQHNDFISSFYNGPNPGFVFCFGYEWTRNVVGATKTTRKTSFRKIILAQRWNFNLKFFGHLPWSFFHDYTNFLLSKCSNNHILSEIWIVDPSFLNLEIFLKVSGVFFPL